MNPRVAMCPNLAKWRASVKALDIRGRRLLPCDLTGHQPFAI